MKIIVIRKLFERGVTGRGTILITSIVLIYLIISLYFTNHCFFNTVINGVDLSLKAYYDVNGIINNYVNSYKLKLIERNGGIEEITGQDIEMYYSEQNNIYKIFQIQSSYKWLTSLFGKQKYYVVGLFAYDKEKLERKISELSCLNKAAIEPQNVGFKFLNGSYEVIEEVYGNKIYEDKLNNVIEMSILQGETKVDLNETLCYENPKYTLSSDKTLKTRNLLNKYVSAKITYIFGSEKEVLDQEIISQWLSVDENLEVVINEKKVMNYVHELSKRYDTVGIAREFKTSTNKIVEVKGGFYGWEINRAAETRALLKSIKLGEVIEKEPVYTQKALSRSKNDIGNTYVEINITKQHLWFYKEGRLITHGAVVTGNPNRGNSTKTGVYMLNYKEKGSTLRGPDYEAEVTYWMPFNGNIGLHDASWRYSFGGDIYKRNGTHGCVNAPLFLAKRIFDNIKDGTPVICYEE